MDECIESLFHPILNNPEAISPCLRFSQNESHSLKQEMNLCMQIKRLGEFDETIELLARLNPFCPSSSLECIELHWTDWTDDNLVALGSTDDSLAEYKILSEIRMVLFSP
jgi:hypothetical protein